MKQKDEDRKKEKSVLYFRFFSLEPFSIFNRAYGMYVVHQRPKSAMLAFSFSFPTHHLQYDNRTSITSYTGTQTTSKRNIYYRYHQPAMPPKTKQNSKKGTAKPKRVPHANETPLKHKAPGHGAVERAKGQMWDEPSSTSSGGGGGSSSLLPQTTTTAPKPKYKATTTTSISSMMMGIGRGGGGGIGSGGSITKKKVSTTASRKTGTTTTRSAVTIIPSSAADNNNNNNNTERKVNPDFDFFSSSKSASKQ